MNGKLKRRLTRLSNQELNQLLVNVMELTYFNCLMKDEIKSELSAMDAYVIQQYVIAELSKRIKPELN